MRDNTNKWRRLARKLLLDETVPQDWHNDARAAFERGDAKEFVELAVPCGGTLAIVYDNDDALLERGVYEAALVHGYVATTTNWADWDLDVIKSLFNRGSREEFRKVGSPLNGNGPFTVYRGVKGSVKDRRECGISWTGSLEIACWFAKRFGGDAAAVNVAKMYLEDIYCYYTERNEDEYLGIPRTWERLPLTIEEIARHDAVYRASKQG